MTQAYIRMEVKKLSLRDVMKYFRCHVRMYCMMLKGHREQRFSYIGRVLQFMLVALELPMAYAESIVYWDCIDEVWELNPRPSHFLCLSSGDLENHCFAMLCTNGLGAVEFY